MVRDKEANALPPLLQRWIRPSALKGRNIYLKGLILLLLLLILIACAPPGKGGSGISERDGILFLASKEGKVFALNPQIRSKNLPFPGEGEWVYPQKGKLGSIYATPVPSQGKVYVATFEGKIFALDMKTGREGWSRALGDSIIGSPVVVGKRLLVASGENLFALDSETGGDLWQKPFKAKGRIWASPIIKEDIIYITSMDRSLYALDFTGRLLWRFETEGAFVTSPLLVEDTIFIASFDRNIYAIDRVSGVLKWESPFKAGHWFWTPLIFAEGKVFAGALDKNFYAIEAKSGKLIWQKSFPSPPSSATIEGGIIILATAEGKIYGLDLETGEKRWFPFNVLSPVAPLFAHKGVVYAHAQDGILYALDVGTGKLLWSFSLKGR